jgi:methionine synthase II (cobalamin-independent)
MEWVCDVRNPNLRTGDSATIWRDYKRDTFKLLEKVGIDTHGMAERYSRAPDKAA